MRTCHGVSLNGLCPVCCFGANISQQLGDSQTVKCERCGHFDLSDAAQDIFNTFPEPLNRRRLSEVMIDVCTMAECERPMIDCLTASTMLAFATM